MSGSFVREYERSQKAIKIPQGVTEICAGVFAGCENLSSVSIPDSVTDVERGAFDGCPQLVDKTDGVSYVDGWLTDCDTRMRDVYIKENTRGIADEAFSWCSSLCRVTIPDGVKRVGYGAFENCRALEKVRVGSGVISIGGGAFSGCWSLKEIEVAAGNKYFFSRDGVLYDRLRNTIVKVPARVSGRVTIPDCVGAVASHAFDGCANLTELVVGCGVSAIYREAFRGCAALSRVFFKGTATVWSKIFVGAYNGELLRAARYYYSENEPEASNLGGNEVGFWHYATDGETPVLW